MTKLTFEMMCDKIASNYKKKKTIWEPFGFVLNMQMNVNGGYDVGFWKDPASVTYIIFCSASSYMFAQEDCAEITVTC